MSYSLTSESKVVFFRFLIYVSGGTVEVNDFGFSTYKGSKPLPKKEVGGRVIQNLSEVKIIKS